MESEQLTSLGKYRIEATLGVGAMGVVYRAFDPQLGRPVALKTIRQDLFECHDRASLSARFLNEARAAGRLVHPNVVTVFDYGESDGVAYIAMEYVSGCALSRCLQDGAPLDLRNALDWFAQLLAALGCAHRQGIVHRDLKPANLLITAEGQLKIADFGIAHVESSALTVVGAVVGTPNYMAPEQHCGNAVDGRSDLYSAAVVLYQMLTGKRPFSGTPADVAQQILHAAPCAPSVHNAALPAAIDAVLLRALAKERNGRYQTAADFGNALFNAVRDRHCMTPMTTATTGDTSLTRACSSIPLPAADLAAVEARLAAQIGPVARLLIARAARDATDLPSLGSLLAQHIPSDKGRKQFTDAVATLADASLRGADARKPASAASALQPDDILAAARELAVYIGPIAQIIAKREARKALTLCELLERLSNSIAGASDRARYRRVVGLPEL